ncbi:pre-mRNA cleavage complex 2 protein Pcf11 isoform X1 [Leptidea sinapis]|uniref:pre-mRNA cleavage complex 2 protein Pcf11 isoform X1 n=1 Tax=Leptidea sinapis TaxID=189913 RepID=UPI0021C47785|nr:pre-mRNA cleavage complex 2 protein Pcf11 isoform X1 [Leptidea sinapis]XP_050672812.1 pre-mRNA cleavage complex 2 protein Pcf11 isoform X1 [Leptidea sinapis]
MSKEKEISDEYASSLADLTVNSKPLINMLTILAEENIEHAGIIVDTVEKHLEKVHSDIKLPVLYLVDSIIKNVGGAYTQKFSQIIVNIFTKTFKQVDEKVRSQMFKLRETWHDVFPSTKLYQLDVKVNLIDPAWPIQAQPHQANIHVNPNFLKKAPAPTTSTLTDDEERMRSILAKKEQELLMLQRKKVEMELEQTRRQLELAEKTTKKRVTPSTNNVPLAMVNPVVAPVMPQIAAVPTVPDIPVVPPPVQPELAPVVSVKQRLGPPVNKSSGAGRIAPVSGALATARRDPRLSRRQMSNAVAPPIAPNVFDIKPLDRVIKHKNVITIDVPNDIRAQRRRDPRLVARNRHRPKKSEDRRHERDNKDKDLTNDDYIDRLQIPDPKKINKLPPIPKINRDEPKEELPPTTKRKKDIQRERKKRKEENEDSKDSSGSKDSSSSPDKRQKIKDKKAKLRDCPEVTNKAAEQEVVAFKELKNYHKERYMRRNKEKSESPEHRNEKVQEIVPEESTNVPEVIVENKDVDLRILHPVIVEQAASIAQKRPSTEALDCKVKKNKLEKFDILFGNEDVDLRQLPQVEEVSAPTLVPNEISVVKEDAKIDDEEEVDKDISPVGSPKKDWNEVKEKEATKKTPSKLDLVRAKLAEATKSKDRLGRPFLFSKSPSVEKERRRTLSTDENDVHAESVEEFDADDHKKTISIIMSQAKEQYNDGQLDKNQYNTLMYQVLQLNEKLKLKEAKQRESLEVSKRKLKAHIDEENHKIVSPKSSPSDANRFGDIDERVTPAPFVDIASDNKISQQDSDMRINHDDVENEMNMLPPMPPMMPMFPPMGPFPMWRGQPRPRMEDFGPRRFRGPMPPFFRGKFDRMPRPPFDPRMPMPPLPTPMIGMFQGESPLTPYERCSSPPPLGAPGCPIPPTDYRIIEYIDRDPVKTIQIDSIPREIRFYGETAIIMLDWDDPREIKFLPGCRRVTFDNKDSVVLSFNEGYKKVEMDDQTFNIRFGAPTREMYINDGWYECFFGGQPMGVIIDGKPHLVHLEGPLPQVDIGKTKRTDLVAGKINLIVNATIVCPVYLDAKVQKFQVNGQFFTIRFVDALRTVLINERPFQVEFGDLPKPIYVNGEKYFIRFSALPKNIKPGYVDIANMEGSLALAAPSMPVLNHHIAMETDEEQPTEDSSKVTTTENENQGLDMLASLMPTSMAPAASSEYTTEAMFSKPEVIPGLGTEEKPNPMPMLANINVNDLFAKLVATGIVSVVKEPEKTEIKSDKSEKIEDAQKVKEDKNVIHRVDFFKPETLRVKQPGIVAKLYGGMQCSGCGARFPPEHTVRYSQHLDWHFRQNRRERDSARRAHSRHWHYDLSDWVLYEEVEDLEEREKSWFETGGAEEGEKPVEVAEETPSAAAGPPAEHHCALCGDTFDQFYNEDKEEWHLRNSVRHDDNYYHPLCYDDYKASISKDEPKEESTVDIIEESKEPEAIEIKDLDDDDSDNESVVEVLEPEQTIEAVEVDDGDEDDVVLKCEPVEQVVVRDDEDTDDETVAERDQRDQQAALLAVTIKQEPIDPDDEPIITAEEEHVAPPPVEIIHSTVTSSIDGNLQLEDATPTVAFGGIRININKVPTFVNSPDDKVLDDISADDEPLPPGEEEELEFKLKPTLEGIQFGRQPPVQRGSELSGLCSIM